MVNWEGIEKPPPQASTEIVVTAGFPPSTYATLIPNQNIHNLPNHTPLYQFPLQYLSWTSEVGKRRPILDVALRPTAIPRRGGAGPQATGGRGGGVGRPEVAVLLGTCRRPSTHPPMVFCTEVNSTKIRLLVRFETRSKLSSLMQCSKKLLRPPPKKKNNSSLGFRDQVPCKMPFQALVAHLHKLPKLGPTKWKEVIAGRRQQETIMIRSPQIT